MARRKDVGKDLYHKNMSRAGKTSDPWYMLLHESKTQGRDPKTAFVCDVRVGAEPFCVFGRKRQLNDLKRFTVDPTFDFGPYNVKAISHQHLLVHCREDGNHPTMIGPVLLHEKKTQLTHSLFGGTLKSLKPELKNLMAFGTDEEKVLVGGFNESFERATNLLCETNLRKNLDTKLVSLDIKGDSKRTILNDIFGRKVDSVFESGLSDAGSVEEFIALFESLEEKWLLLHSNGKTFHSWFDAKKKQDFLRSVISPVCQSAGLGCPPEKFTTNRSQRANGVLQDCVKRECGTSKVDKYALVKIVEKLVKSQEQELELAVLDKGEYQLCQEFYNLIVSGDKWAKMANDQRKEALLRIHSISLDEASQSNVASVNERLGEVESATSQQILSAGVDWITPDVIRLIAQKGEHLQKEGKVTQVPAASAYTTLIIPSKCKPTKRHIIVVYPNGKVECQDCQGYSASSLCAHAVAASLKLGTLEGADVADKRQILLSQEMLCHPGQ